MDPIGLAIWGAAALIVIALAWHWRRQDIRDKERRAERTARLAQLETHAQANPGWAVLQIVHYFGTKDGNATFMLQERARNARPPVTTTIIGMDPGYTGGLGAWLLVSDWPRMHSTPENPTTIIDVTQVRGTA